MSYREYPVNVALKRATPVDCKVSGAVAIATTDPNMWFELQNLIFEIDTVSGLTVNPVFSMGTVGPSYAQQYALAALAGITTNHQVSQRAPNGTDPQAIAPGTQIFLNVSTPATATTFLMNAIIVGVYR